MNYWICIKNNVIELGVGDGPKNCLNFKDKDSFKLKIDEIEKEQFEQVPDEEKEFFNPIPIFEDLEIDSDNLDVEQMINLGEPTTLPIINEKSKKEYKAVLIDGFIKTEHLKNIGVVTSIEDAIQKLKKG